jgi:hypothetical protein
LAAGLAGAVAAGADPGTARESMKPRARRQAKTLFVVGWFMLGLIGCRSS